MKIVAIDFDGTLVQEKFPDIGDPIPNMVELCKKINKDPNYKLILWTCREGKQLEDALSWCKNQGISFDAVNDNLEEIKNEWHQNVRKIYCDVYIDDKNLVPYGELDFERVRSICENSTRSKNTIS